MSLTPLNLDVHHKLDFIGAQASVAFCKGVFRFNYASKANAEYGLKMSA